MGSVVGFWWVETGVNQMKTVKCEKKQIIVIVL
jgi:hypothetical protein